MSQQKLTLEEVSKNMGIQLPKSGDVSPESQTKPASAAELQEDSQAPERNPKLQILLIGLALFSTLGIGTMLLLWGLGSATTPQVAKKPDSLSSEQATASTPEQQKEVADLKTKLVMEQQKSEAARLAAQQAKASSPSPTPTPSSSALTTPVATANATKPIEKMQPSDSDRAQLASLQQQKQQEAAQLASLQQQKQQEAAQLASLRQSRQREASQPIAARPQPASEKSQASLRSQRNGNIARTFSPQPARVVQRNQIAAAQIPKISQPTVAPQPRLDWEQASSLANYGGTSGADSSIKPTDRSFALTGNSAMSPVLRLPVGQVVSGKLVTPFYTLISDGGGMSQNAKASATVTIDKAVEVGSGWHLPVGTAIEFELQIADNGMIQAVSKKVTYGNTEIAIPPGAFSITGNDNQPLFAQIKEVNGSQLAAADTRAAIFGGAAELGNVLVNSGNSSTVTVGLGTTIATQSNASPNILGALVKGAFSPLAQTQISRANTMASRVDKMSKVGYLLPGTPMRVYVAQAATFQLPMDNSNPPQTLSLTQNYQPTPEPKVARLDNSATSLIVETPTDPEVIQSVTNSGGANVVAPNPFYVSPLQKPSPSPQYVRTPTQSSIQPPAIESNYTTAPARPQVTSNQPLDRSPAIDPNNTTVPTQPLGTPTQPSIQPQAINPDYTTVPTQPPGTPVQSFTPQPPTINPNYPAAPTQPITVQTSQGNYVIK
ncbi:hypothetical protein [Chamaesiphon minutus]|uniref:Uncharacterized protein n=1 Tax=Chamaesiphon minutus (strain ATCC 27169 / PCC 6605) TaxID=1173020 RepID=K9URB2_CHAP6|nr:hypothetical protein [Chamaesiphon minutus]AFY97218.1 hypothetical protein Cha6605_6399 [Chamaesiphon minutus PCC 6605]